MQVMRAWRSDGRGDLWLSAQVDDLARQVHGDDLASKRAEVVVEVEAANISSFDLRMVKEAPADRVKPPFTPGRQVAGVVVSGPEFARGTRVVGMTLPGNGAWAERALADPHDLMVVPKAVSADDALALFLPGQTAALAMWQRARVSAGEVVVVFDPISSVGALALQIAVRAGATVVAVAGKEWEQRLAGLGAKEFVDTGEPNWITRLEQQYKPVDVVVDLLGSVSVDQSVRLLGFDGRVIVGAGDSSTRPIDTAYLASRSASVLGVSWSAYRRERPAVLDKAATRLFDLLLNSHLNPAVHRRIDFNDIGTAVDELSGRGVSGTMLIAPTSSSYPL